jgi:hypothetical protein
MVLNICFALLFMAFKVIITVNGAALHADYQGCSVDKGCFGSKFGSATANCVTTGDCQMFASWKYLQTTKKFQILVHAKAAASNNYVAVALSEDSKMGTDLAFSCISGSTSEVSVLLYCIVFTSC